METERNLGFVSLAALLISTHYGLGFLLGTAEKALTLGWGGSLYAICLGLGTLILLLGLGQFYWHKQEPIWNLLGDRYGASIKTIIGLMSWASLIGLFAVQLIAGAFILKVIGFSVLGSTTGLAIFFLILSLLPVEKASILFRILLTLNVIALFAILAKLHGFNGYLHAPIDFIPAVIAIPRSSAIGIIVSTLALLQIDMKYQQFAVRAQNLRQLYLGYITAAIGLFLLALLPAAVVIAAQKGQILPSDLDGKEIIPWLLAWFGGGVDNPLGLLLIISIIIPAFGVGSSILRIQTKIILDFHFIPVTPSNQIIIPILNTLLGLGVALKGGEIVNLIVDFYAIYVATTWPPFIAYLLANRNLYNFRPISIKFSLYGSALTALGMLIFTLFKPEAVFWGSPELTIMVVTASLGILGLGIGEIVEKWVLAPMSEKTG